MLAKRIIPCLDVKDGQTVKGVQFENLIFAGDAVALGTRYAQEGADELCFLDITATQEKRKTLSTLVKRIAKHVDIPFTVGGGISSLDDISAVLEAGADKITINSAAVHNPDLIAEAAARFGSQCIVLAIDAKMEKNEWYVYTHGGKKRSPYKLFSWAKEMQERGAGEILFTAMNQDGMKNGFALEATDKLAKMLHIPVIASGGAGKLSHFEDLFIKTSAEAGLAASIFHFNEIPIPTLKAHLKTKNIAIR
ncbi:MAG: imidazole glycerol phosphate synthase subunit HisF [Bernardetiaceae bacterium]|nr:imidazole glycerol phosphate synthase subunit HisF [Bernardetiaceae bacterium]